jgi:hypothetical protein
MKLTRIGLLFPSISLLRDLFFFLFCQHNAPPPPALLDGEEIEEVIDTLTERVADSLMHTLNLLKLTMMKVDHQIWIISMNIEVRKKLMLELSLMMLHTR